MFSSLSSIPTSLATSTWSYLSNRKKTFAYLGASVGGVYAVGQWGLQRVMEASERGRKDQGAKNDLLHRFNLNLQDAQFTVQALLPTVATQLQEALDVEDRTTQLGEMAKAERQAKLKELEKVKREKEESEAKERLAAEQEKLQEEREQQNGEVETEEEKAELPNGHNVERLEESQETSTPAPTEPSLNGTHSEAEERTNSQESPTSTKPSLNPDAPAFQPRFSAPSPPPPSAPQTDDFPRLNGHLNSTLEQEPTKANGFSHSREDETKESEKAASEDGETNGLGKSWAEVVKTTNGDESVENGKAEVEVSGQPESEESKGEESERATLPIEQADPSSSVAQVEAAEEPAPEVVETPSLPTKSKVQLWSEIKVLSFTRLFTSIYVLSLLTLQTHVQLALLGRAHYVKSLVDSLPPRSPSPSSSTKGKEKQFDLIEPSMSNEDDLEASLYKAKELPTSREEDRVDEEVERKYLTFSWWLLHEGWKVVRNRVEEKVEEVVGPMGLKTPVVYGELSALFGEIRKRIETQSDGTKFDFSAALHPPSPADELLTLVTGGGFPSPSPPPSPSSSSPALTSPLIPPPLRSLLNETSDFLLSPDGSLVLTLLLDRLLAHSVSKLEPAFGSPATVNDDGRGARFEDVTEKQTRLASLLPVLTRLSAAGMEGQEGILRGGHGNEFVEAIDDVRELREFVAIVYASYDRDNLRASY